MWTDHKNLSYIRNAKRLDGRYSLAASTFPDLSRQFPDSAGDPGQETILLASCVLAAVSWEIEAVIQEALWTDPDPGNGHSNRLYLLPVCVVRCSSGGTPPA